MKIMDLPIRRREQTLTPVSGYDRLQRLLFVAAHQFQEVKRLGPEQMLFGREIWAIVLDPCLQT